MSAPASDRMTPAEFLAFERRSEAKHELVDGRVLAMTGASRRHNQIVRNILMGLESRLRRTGDFEAYGSDLRVKTDQQGSCTYPDVSVTCGEPEFEDGELDTLLNPILLVEVLSPTTEAWDRGGKWERYRSLASLKEYLLVAQRRVHVERFARRADGTWTFSESVDPEEVLDLETVGVELPIAEIYERVAFGVDEPRDRGWTREELYRRGSS